MCCLPESYTCVCIFLYVEYFSPSSCGCVTYALEGVDLMEEEA